MKTTLDLPEALMKEVKIRAVREGRKLKDMVADLLRKGLVNASSVTTSTTPRRSARVTTDPETGLPLIECRANAPARKMTAQELVDLEQDTLTKEDRERLGVSL